MSISNIFLNASKITDRFNIDIDDLYKKRVINIVKNLQNTLDIEEIRVFKAKRKHYHICVKLKNPKPIWFLLLVRILCFDDMDRVRLDISRLAINKLKFFDYVSQYKYQITVKKQLKIKMVSKYEEILCITK